MAEFTLKVEYAGLSPEMKLKILKEMGFREDGPLEHAVDCVSRQGSGFICTCWPGTTSFKAPADVKRYMGEDETARQEFARRRQEFQNDGDGENPGPWYAHLERTAPRYNT